MSGLTSPALPGVLVVHGPNLNLLGSREPEIYGRTTLAELDRALVKLGAELGLRVRCVQASGEGAIIDLIHEARIDCAAIILNPGGYAHTSVAIADALRAVGLPALEVHLSNVHAREPFRHRCLTAAACRGVIAGFGPDSYTLALRQTAAMVGSGSATASPGSGD
jgi:3-dehydroquinate dehydratase II